MKYLKLSVYFLLVMTIGFTTTVFAEKGSVVSHEHNDRSHSHALPIEGLNHSHGKKQSTISGKYWLAIARDSKETFGYSARETSKKEAEAKALKSCNDNEKSQNNCKVLMTSDVFGYAAIAASKLYTSLYTSDDKVFAKQKALEDCANNTLKTDHCYIVFEVLNGSFKKPKKITPQKNTNKNCRPRSANIRCTSQCNNGSCVVEYENGCKINVNVQPRFDPLSSQWSYQTPSC